MITKEEFIGLISSHIEWLDKIERVSKILGINIWESSCTDYASLLFEKVMNLVFQEPEVDTIYWWMFERRKNKDLKMKIDGKEVPSETLDDLWNLVKDYRK